MSLPGPNVRISLDPRHLPWPYLLRDPDPPTTATDCASGWPCRQRGFQGQRNRSKQQFKFACCQCCQQSWPIVAGPDESASAIPSAGCATRADSESHRLRMLIFSFELLLSPPYKLSSLLRLPRLLHKDFAHGSIRHDLGSRL